jgi:hypothetical protein
MAEQCEIPNFVEVFSEVRDDPTKHLMRKDEEGEYLVPDSEILKFAEVIRASQFYCEAWLAGCEPATVLFEPVIRDLSSDNLLRVRKAVNAAYGAETRILAMGLNAYIEWRRAGMPATPKVKAEKPKPSAKKVAAKQSSMSAVPLHHLKPVTAGRLMQVWLKKHLVEEMPESLREQLERAVDAMGKGHLFQPTAEAILLAVEQWLRLRREQRIHLEAKEEAKAMAASAIQQYELMLDLLKEHPGDDRIRDQLQSILGVITAGDPKALAAVLRAGDRLHGLINGTIVPVEPAPAPQNTTNIADAEYIRSRLGHLETPARGRVKPNADKAGAGKRKSSF